MNAKAHPVTNTDPLSTAKQAILAPRRGHLIIAGAAPDTGNLGVSALCESAVCGCDIYLPDDPIAVLDHGNGLRPSSIPHSVRPIDYQRLGAAYTKRFYRRRAWARIQWDAKFGGWCSPAAAVLLNAKAILDVSGGDSFTDLYGRWRFEAIAQPKQFAQRHRIPLILLPQTYGPFEDSAVRRRAIEYILAARLVFARDRHSHALLETLLGERFDPDRHRCGVDLAFLLAARRPATAIEHPIAEWLSVQHAHPVAGVNISGLLYVDQRATVNQYGLRVDYRQLVEQFIARLLETTTAKIVLVPHVVTPEGHIESDISACQQVKQKFDSDRLAVLSGPYDHAEVKHIISRFHWFCGTRMHSTIAALSSGVPAAAIAYSDKTLGVFETCQFGHQVFDPRSCAPVDIVDGLVDSFAQRVKLREQLSSALPAVLDQAQHQLRVIAKSLNAAASNRTA